MKELVGRVITAVSINGDQSLLWFDTTTGPVVYSAGADCCSESWFADITGADWLKDRVVLATEELETDYRVEDERTRQMSDIAYGYTLATRMGTVTIIFRNSSNGYYGGWLDKVSPDRPSDLVEITEHDWQA